jgi:hypothetical protein
MSDDRDQLGIPPGAAVWTARGKLMEGWSMDEVGIRLDHPPPRPWPWPWGMMKTRSGRVWFVVQLWRHTLRRPGFAYSVLWHPDHGRHYRVESRDPDIADLVKDAQRLFRRETRGRKRHRPSPERFIADRDRIRHASGGIEPSPTRMAEEYGVEPSTVRRWLQRREWATVRNDRIRAE